MHSQTKIVKVDIKPRLSIALVLDLPRVGRGVTGKKKRQLGSWRFTTVSRIDWLRE